MKVRTQLRRASLDSALVLILFPLIALGCCDDLADDEGADDKDDFHTVERVGHIEDIDGNSYPYIEIDGRHFTAKSLETTRYRNGDEIPQVQDPAEWAALTTGPWA